MEIRRCFDPKCENEVEYACKCTSPETYSCKDHFMAHCELRNRTHIFESVFLEPCEETKDTILRFLVSEKTMIDELKEKFAASFSKNLQNCEVSFDNYLTKLDSNLEKIRFYLEKISNAKKLSKLEQDPVLKLLSLNPDEALKKVKEIIPKNQDSNSDIWLFCGLSQKVEKMINSFVKNKFEAYLENKICSAVKRFELILNSNSNLVKEMAQQFINVDELMKSDDEKHERFLEMKEIVEKTIEKIINIDKILENQSKHISLVANGTYCSITEIKNKIDGNKRKIEVTVKEAGIKAENDVKLIKSQLQNINEDINKRIFVIEKRLDSFSTLMKGIEEIIIEEKKKETQQKIQNDVNLCNFQPQSIIEDSSKTHLVAEKSTNSFDSYKNHIEDQKSEFYEKRDEIAEKCENSNKENLINEKSIIIENESLHFDISKLNNKPYDETNLSKLDRDSEISKLNQKISKIYDGANLQKIDRDFRRTSLWYNKQIKEASLDPSVFQAYQDYVAAYNKRASLYLISTNSGKQTELLVFDTENEKEEVKILETPKQLNWGSCICLLPNGELFCFGSGPASGTSLIIDKNYNIKMLPSGTPTCWSSAIYFKKNIYCFGGKNKKSIPITLSESFNIEENRWIKLTPLPKADFCSHSIVFNDNILVSGFNSRNILRYSIKDNNFTIIPFEFAEEKRKILIYINRLYLIECDGVIYESEIGNENAWKQIKNSIIGDCCPSQAYFSHNKECIYIGCSSIGRYYKFGLDQKNMVNL